MSAGSAIGRDIPPFRGIIEELRCGKVVPFLGAGASGLRAAGALPPLPSGAELARRIALDAEFPVEDDRDLKDLPKVASYYVDKINRDALRRNLRRIFSQPQQEFNDIHRLLAEIANNNLFIITTNYDAMLENAFRSLGKRYDVIVYTADDTEYANAVLRWRDGETTPERLIPNKLDVSSIENRNVIYKMHGSVHAEEVLDSFVITEDDYVTFLARIKQAVPPAVKRLLSTREFLFLGYGLTDWNTRVLLRQVNQLQRVNKSQPRSWAIQRDPAAFERTLWERRGVDLYPMDLGNFISELRQKGGL